MGWIDALGNGDRLFYARMHRMGIALLAGRYRLSLRKRQAKDILIPNKPLHPITRQIFLFLERRGERQILAEIRRLMEQNDPPFTDEDRGLSVFFAAQVGSYTTVQMLLATGPIPPRMRAAAIALQNRDIVRLLEQPVPFVPRAMPDPLTVSLQDEQNALNEWRQLLDTHAIDQAHALEMTPDTADQVEEQFMSRLTIISPFLQRANNIIELFASPVVSLIRNGGSEERIRAHLQSRPIGTHARSLALRTAMPFAPLGAVRALLASGPILPADQHHSLQIAQQRHLPALIAALRPVP
ncbi:MAG TPA: hypothetical protein VLF94_08585 [Chlamydiales bacterium]|nr:hypothetical protein [Chlamydiales bacterium]